jgi:hypothetical protein
MTDDRVELSKRVRKAIAESRGLMAEYRRTVKLMSQRMVELRISRESFLEMKAKCRRVAFH